MKSLQRNLFRLLSSIPVCVGCVNTLSAQENDGEPVYELSPFTISDADDTGYQATSTLAGTRIRTDLRDLGAAISVITSEFLEDTAATDAATLLSYTTNTEVGGNQGNFSGADDVSSSRYFQPDARTNPQFNQRIRGLGEAALTRGYFLTEIPFDSYNTSRVTINRGPNSLLFGIGDPGGIINNSLKMPIMGSDFSEVQIRYGSHDSLRGTIDLNREIIEDRVAIRIAGLYEDENFRQKPAWERDERAYAAINAVLFKNDNNDFFDPTRLKVNGEMGAVRGSPVEIVPPSRAYDNWFNPYPASNQQFTGVPAPSTVISPNEGGTWEFQETFNPFETGLESDINTNVHPAFFRRIPLMFNDANASVPTIGLSGPDPLGQVSDLSLIAGTEAANNWRANTDTVASAGLTGTPGVAGIVAAAGGDPAMTPLTGHQLYGANSPFGEGYSSGFAVPTIQNRDVFDYRNHVYSGGLDRIERDFYAYNFALEQTFLDNRFGIEFAYDKQRYESKQDFFFTGGGGTSTTGPYDIQIDINEFLLNGLPNPNLGRAYTRVSGTRLRNQEWEREAGRATVFGEFDFTEETDGWARFLGRHRLTGLFSDQTIDQFDESFFDTWVSQSEDISSIANDTNLTGGRRRLNVAVYTSGDLRGVQSMDDVRLQQINIRRPLPGESFEIMYADVGKSDPAERRAQSGPMQIRRVLDAQNVERQTIESRAASWQSYFFDEHIVGLLGWRDDDSESFDRKTSGQLGFSQTFADGTWNPEATQLTDDPVFIESGETITWSVVGRYPEKWLGELPGNSNLQFHYGESENFNPIGLRNDTLGQKIPQPTGVTKEYGFLVEMLGGKLNIKVNWFETDLLKVGAGAVANVGGFFESNMNKYIQAELDGVEFDEHRSLVGIEPWPSSITTYQQFYDAMSNALPGNLESVLNPRFVDTDGDGNINELQVDTISNLSATSDRAAEGMEIEVIASPTDSWTLLVNVSQQETVQTNTAPINAAAAEAFLQGMEAGGILPLHLDPGQAGGGAVRSLGSQWLQTDIADIRGARAKDGALSNEQREWRVTGVTKYSFNEGRLAGFGLGGAIRWEDEAATGYVTRIVDGVPVPDITKPFFDDGLFSGDVFLTYERRIFGDINWKVQLNVRNAFGDDDDIPVKTNPDGQIAVIRIPNPTTVYLSNTFRF